MIRFLKTAAVRLGFHLSRSERSADAEYVEAFAAYRKALQRGDTRTQGEAWTRLCKAQIARLKAEVPCRAIGWRGLAR